ncbi:hypothetical protein B0H17DRAFT_1147792 [Mycena rosella]|uniref:Uncharacterized protein n=1 Tax=Mycena rosella TaxID=1033263 RepID=A0AAD7FXT4_MYCRO|nr:hypothetical protein B0H17DRAFT_1147792 [Mycena rosella]
MSDGLDHELLALCWVPSGCMQYHSHNTSEVHACPIRRCVGIPVIHSNTVKEAGVLIGHDYISRQMARQVIRIRIFLFRFHILWFPCGCPQKRPRTTDQRLSSLNCFQSRYTMLAFVVSRMAGLSLPTRKYPVVFEQIELGIHLICYSVGIEQYTVRIVHSTRLVQSVGAREAGTCVPKQPYYYMTRDGTPNPPGRNVGTRTLGHALYFLTPVITARNGSGYSVQNGCFNFDALRKGER